MQETQKVLDRTWLEKARRIKGYSQAQAGAAAGCTAAYYNRIEKGLNVPNVVIAVRLSDVLDFDVHNFLNEKAVE